MVQGRHCLGIYLLEARPAGCTLECSCRLTIVHACPPLPQDLRQPGYGQLTEMDAPAKGPAVGVKLPSNVGMPKDTALQTGGTNTFEVRHCCYGCST